jgi:hypothetical protein
VKGFLQLIGYQKILWCTGYLGWGTIGDGSGSPEKANDEQLLLTFLDTLQRPGGLYLSGDDIAEEWARRAPGGLQLGYIQHRLIAGDHASAGFPLSPLAIGDPGGCFDHVMGPDTLVAHGGCPVTHDFDVIEPDGPSTQEMYYDGGMSGADGAIVAQRTTNPYSVDVGVILSGFSFESIRDYRATGIPARAHHLRDILVWLENLVGEPTGIGDTPELRTALGQSFPNPFNPTTTIRYTLRDRAHVSLKVYDVAGRLVKTLVNELQSPRPEGFEATWNGENEAGEAVASGVYFCKFIAGDFVQTRKLVLLK